VVHIDCKRLLITIRGVPDKDIPIVLRGISDYFNVCVVGIHKREGGSGGRDVH